MSEPDGQVTRPPRVLVVDDEVEFAELVRLWLDGRGWEAEVCLEAASALAAFARQPPDLVLLDVGLPGLDGWNVLSRIRSESDVPVLLVTARGDERDKVRGLELGADDYVTKPLSFPELLARSEAALRRARHDWPSVTAGVIRHGPLSLDPIGHRAHVSGVEIHLTPTEFRLLQHLAERPERVVSHRELLETAWGAGYGNDTHLLQATVRNLRLKLARVTEARLIDTVYGLGYRLADRTSLEPDGASGEIH